jgi:hypothetical protein
MSDKRLPSFNDFSPGLFPDIRRPLIAIRGANGDRARIIEKISSLKEWPVSNKRAKNVIITLQFVGVLDKDANVLTEFGESIASAPSPVEGACRFCKRVLEKMNGLRLVEAIQGLNKRNVPVSKASLKTELVRLGITGLSTATTDHLTLANWLVACGVLSRTGKTYAINDASLKSLVGITSEEASALDELDPPQRLFALVLRRIVVTESEQWIPAKRIITECLRDYPQLFDEDQMRKKVIEPLQHGGWISTTGLSAGQGAKSGQVRAEKRLKDIPLEYIIPNFDGVVPSDLRARIDTPLSRINNLLESEAKHDRGLGLELLALRIILDLSLTPSGFRKRAKSTGYAELDVIAEGKNLLFSRWTFQCKCVQRTSNVDAEDVAREVGIAIHAKAHVVVMVSTGGFTSAARDFAREITSSTHLQFLFLDGSIVREYLAGGVAKLIEHVLQNAANVMRQKQEQLPAVIVPATLDAQASTIG